MITVINTAPGMRRGAKADTEEGPVQGRDQDHGRGGEGRDPAVETDGEVEVGIEVTEVEAVIEV